MLTAIADMEISTRLLLVQTRDGVPDGERRTYGALRIVLVRDRRAEDGDHGVADELLHRATAGSRARSRACSW